MMRISLLPLLLMCILTSFQNPEEEIDMLWDEVSRTVAEGDFEGYSDTFHADAVLVNEISGTSYPISEALAGWEQGFIDTKAGKMSASVEFRFSKRLHGEKTAHDTGIFKYSSKIKGEKERIAYVNFQGLLVKTGSSWKMLMEYQISVTSEEEWKALK